MMGVSGKGSTPAPETVAVRKNNFASSLRFAPGPLFGLVFLGSIFILFLTLIGQCQFRFLYFNNFLTNRSVIAQCYRCRYRYGRSEVQFPGR